MDVSADVGSVSSAMVDAEVAALRMIAKATIWRRTATTGPHGSRNSSATSGRVRRRRPRTLARRARAIPLWHD
ncbi:hypothetical protein IP86_00195 [Rhodopseudomonas sp. AAP120]|nr:hypothetical protein IP86_00195 [Rhodopseudomonas sp. AAP120]